MGGGCKELLGSTTYVGSHEFCLVSDVRKGAKAALASPASCNIDIPCSLYFSRLGWTVAVKRAWKQLQGPIIINDEPGNKRYFPEFHHILARLLMTPSRLTSKEKLLQMRPS
jgi:hypothetical protein